MLERLKMIWHILTKKHYALFAYNQDVEKYSGAVCYIEDGCSDLFIETIVEYSVVVLNDRKDKREEEKQDDE